MSFEFSEALYKKSKKKKSKRLWLWLVILALILTVVFYILTAVFFDIKEVTINNKSREKDLLEMIEDIFSEKKFFILSQKNIFLFSSKTADKLLKDNFLELTAFSIRKNYLNREIIVEYKPRAPVGVYCSDNNENNCLRFDGEGVFYEETLKILDDQDIFLKVSQDFVLRDKIGNSEYLMDLRDLFNRVGLMVQIWELQDENRWELLVKNSSFEALPLRSWRLIIDPKVYEAKVLAILVMETLKKTNGEIEYLDFRVGNRVYYK